MLRRVVLLLLAVAGFVQCWQCPPLHVPGRDQYLDMARLAVDQHPGWLISGYWSPLYPALLAIAIAILQPSQYWLYPALQLVNAVCYLAALAAFDFLLRTILALRTTGEAKASRHIPSDHGEAKASRHVLSDHGQAKASRPYLADGS
jgi:hypothetical protein